MTPARDFGPLALEAVRERMIKTGNCRKYINQNIGRIKRMFRGGVAKELVPVDVYQSLMAVPGLKHGKSNARETAPILPFDDDTKGDELKAWRKKHRWAPNRLRHSRATKIREQYGLESAQAVLGHASADVTQVYAERDIEKAAAIMREVG